jgi:hypothetical protein
MGGEGSGRLPEKATVGELLMDDKAFKEHITNQTVAYIPRVINELYDIVLGNAEDEIWDSKNCKLVKRKPSLDTRVKAAKVLKEMTLDKVVSDKKTIDTEGQGSLLNLIDDLTAVARAVEKEKAEKARVVGELSTVKPHDAADAGGPLEQRHS